MASLYVEVMKTRLCAAFLNNPQSCVKVPTLKALKIILFITRSKRITKTIEHHDRKERCRVVVWLIAIEKLLFSDPNTSFVEAPTLTLTDLWHRYDHACSYTCIKIDFCKVYMSSCHR